MFAEGLAKEVGEAIVDRNCREQENYEDAAPNFVTRDGHAKRQQTCEHESRINCTEKAYANIRDSRVPSKNVSDQERYDKGSCHKNDAFHLEEVIANWKRNSRRNSQCFVWEFCIASEHEIKLIRANPRSRGNHNHGC